MIGFGIRSTVLVTLCWNHLGAKDLYLGHHHSQESSITKTWHVSSALRVPLPVSCTSVSIASAPVQSVSYLTRALMMACLVSGYGILPTTTYSHCSPGKS